MVTVTAQMDTLYASSDGSVAATFSIINYDPKSVRFSNMYECGIYCRIFAIAPAQPFRLFTILHIERPRHGKGKRRRVNSLKLKTLSERFKQEHFTHQ